jgi:hypothetical protein
MEPHFEIYPEHKAPDGATASEAIAVPTGEYCWRFRAANGAIVAVGGESFTREDDANRAIHEFVQHVLGAQPHPPILTASS